MTNQASGPALQQKYKEIINEKRFTELAKLVESSKEKPADYIVRMGYKNYMEEPQGKKVKLFYIMKLKEIAGINPEKNIIKEACEISLNMDSPEILEALIKRVGFDKSIFKEIQPAVQKTYTDYVADGKFVDVSKLIELTDVIPSEDIIQKGYEGYLEEAKFISFAGLKKRTNIPPDPDMVQSMYRKYHFNYLKYKNLSTEQSTEWLERLKKLMRISKIEPQGITIEEEEPLPEHDN